MRELAASRIAREQHPGFDWILLPNNSPDILKELRFAQRREADGIKIVGRKAWGNDDRVEPGFGDVLRNFICKEIEPTDTPDDDDRRVLGVTLESSR
jgi:hypothetical protein